ncbi:MAG: IF-2-associated domain-containing protein, partial [Steroidobacterales bacterium]
MSDVTIKQLAQVLGLPVDKLLSQLGEAGMKFSDPEQVISSTEKVKLLGFLRRTHGKNEPVAETTDSAPRQITLKRRTVGELKVSTPGGRGAAATAKTVNVEVRAKRTYVKRSVIAEEASAEPEREEAVRKLAESREQRAQEEQGRRDVELRKHEAQQREQEAQQRAQEEAEERRRQAEVEAASAAEPEFAGEPEALAESAQEAAEPVTAVPAADEAQPAVQRLDTRGLGMIVPQVH